MKLKKKYNQLLLSLKLGDGCYVTQTRLDEHKRYNLMVNSINLDYLTYKRDALIQKGIKCTNIGTGKSGYKQSSIVYRFSTRVHPDITEVGNMTVLEAISHLDRIGLVLLFLDDGSLHKHKFFGHIYCNTFTNDEVEALINKIYELYPVKICKKRMDRKKDGRVYPYVYIPVATMRYILKDVLSLLQRYEITSLNYKANVPSQTIESI